MSITPELRASARGAYRALFRASAITFRGDDRVLRAFREKIRLDARESRAEADPEAYASRVKLGYEVAEFLLKNVVQGEKVRDASPNKDGQESSEEVWKLRITEHTERGDNETVKMCSSGSSTSPKNKSWKTAERANSSTPHYDNQSSSQTNSNDRINTQESANLSSSSTSRPRKTNFSTLKRLHQSRVIPQLLEEDIEESFVRGSGPGGQSINKTRNNVQLLHKPTGIRVNCQESRSLSQNRQKARKILLEKLDHLANPGLSKEDLKRAKQVERERRRRKKAKKKAKATDLVDESTGEDES